MAFVYINNTLVGNEAGKPDIISTSISESKESTSKKKNPNLYE